MNPFPSRDQLLRACRGEQVPEHPLLRWARMLTVLHESRIGDSRCDIGESLSLERELVDRIDRWVESRPPALDGVWALHTESVGAVVDRVAQRTAYAAVASRDAGGDELWDAWEELAEAAFGYEDLVAELSTGRRRVPVRRRVEA
ncbi:hypothetical protein D5S18_10205 [Nocardia panacis]|uniref:DUF4254 domain-containing protein n=1 Tax=Nocardia panacis TaxID=2340916 RepID=A0A3A4KA02_9NOCA|nr:hypothetical protein [Nocardia panacis]RJO76640.1 hypothetical protein D5S18_10205 [Nocardia panacis]